MSLLRLALSRPLTIMVAVATIVILSILGISRMKIDIFPQLDLPRITVIQPYGGMDPAQMEGYIVTYYEQHFFYISGVDHVSSRSIQSASVMDVYFQPGTDMADAMAQVVAQVERSRAYMPSGTVTPFIQRFDVGNVPVGFLVFSSETKNVAAIQDLVYTRVRPVVSTIPGVSSPPPFGGNQRSVVVSVSQDKLAQYHMSVDDVVKAIDLGNTIMPSGIVRTGDLQRMTQINSVVGNVQDLGTISLKRNDTGGSVFLRDIAKIEDGTDITTGYALVNGRRTVYMAISKQASASTLAVVDGVKHNIERMQSLLPPDIKVAFEFDQSIYVTQAIEGLLVEGLLGAFLTGLTVLIFLKDVRASFIVILSIPSSLLAAMLGLWACGQTVNIMTLSGMALAVGILVDEGTVVIENIHSHLDHGEPLVPAIYRASLEVLVPRLLAMLSVISVFMPSFFMTGITRSLFVPLSLAVGLAMFASYLLSGTMVPVLAAWLMRSNANHSNYSGGHERKPDFVDRIKNRYQKILIRLVQNKVPVIAIFIICGLSSLIIYPVLGQEIFPAGNPSGFQLRLKAPTGTRFEVTEKIARDVLQMIKQEAGPHNVKVTIGYAGSQPPAYAVAVVYIWTSGPHEAVLLVSLDQHAKINMHDFQEKIREKIRQKYPDLSLTFEAGDIVNKILNFGSATPIQVDVTGPDFANDKAFARRLKENMEKLPQLVDVTISQPLEYPALNIQVDRIRAAELGVSTREIGRAMVASTYSSRFTTPVFWRDPKNGLAYQVQVQIPQGDFDDLTSVGSIPVKTGSYQGPFLRDVARLYYDQVPGEYDHYNMARQISITANLADNDLGRARDAVQKAIKDAGEVPRGVKVTMAGQVPIMQDTFFSLFMGVLFAIVSIYLLLLAFFQSFKLSAIIVSVMPAILFGSLTALLLTGTTINVQSFMGSIMATGVGVANSILVIVFAEEKRLSGMSSRAAAILGASARLRPVMMTSLAMIVGMIPMALGMSEGGDRTAALGRAVIGGLIASTTSVLFILPIIYSLVQKSTTRRGASLLQDFPKLLEETPVSDRDSDMQINKYVTLSILGLATLALSACNRHSDQVPAASAKSIVVSPVPTVAYTEVEQKPLKADLSLPGELAAYQDVPMHAKVEGYITWIGVDRGSQVKKNQSMIKVAAPELVSKVKEAQAKLAAADSAYRQAQSAYESVLSKQAQLEAKLQADTLTFDRMTEAAKTPGAIAKNEVDLSGKGVEADRAAVSSVVAEIQAAKNLVDSQKNNIAAAMQIVQSLKAMETYLDIKAPFDGVVTERNVHQGSIVAVDASRLSAPLVRVQQKSLLRLIVAVPETYVSGIKKGNRIAFTVPAYPGRTFAGTVARLGFALDNKTRTMPVELDVPNASGDLEPGMFATVQWQVARTAPSLFVLSCAVADDLKGTYAIKIDGDRPQRVEVARGPQMGRLVEITPALSTPLKAHDMLVLKATNELEQVERIAPRLASAEDIKKAFKQSGGGAE